MNSERPETPAIVWLAFGMMSFAVVSPVLASFIADHSPGSRHETLGVFFGWMLAGLGAGAFGVFCAIVGALHKPRSTYTKFAVAFAVLLILAAATLGVLLLN